MIVRTFAEWCARARQMLRGRYVRLLEEELTRARADAERLREEIIALRAENRAVVNSLLGTAGVPPIEAPRAVTNTSAVRRRSWTQIATAREIEAGRAERISRGRQGPPASEGEREKQAFCAGAEGP
jgi:hypothetical protein